MTWDVTAARPDQQHLWRQRLGILFFFKLYFFPSPSIPLIPSSTSTHNPPLRIRIYFRNKMFWGVPRYTLPLKTRVSEDAELAHGLSTPSGSPHARAWPQRDCKWIRWEGGGAVRRDSPVLQVSPMVDSPKTPPLPGLLEAVRSHKFLVTRFSLLQRQTPVQV